MDIEKMPRKEINSMVRHMMQDQVEYEKEISLLKEMWNIAYEYGVRVEVDSVTEEIYRHWFENKEV